MIVDAHHHVWDPSVRRQAWLDEIPALNRGQASQAEMRSLVIVVPNKFLHGAAACSEGKEPATV